MKDADACAAHLVLGSCATDLPMQKDAVAIQHQIPLKVIQEQEPIGFELNGALHGFGGSVLVSNEAVEHTALARGGWSAVGDHLHAWPPKTVSVFQTTI